MNSETSIEGSVVEKPCLIGFPSFDTFFEYFSNYINDRNRSVVTYISFISPLVMYGNNYGKCKCFIKFTSTVLAYVVSLIGTVTIDSTLS